MIAFIFQKCIMLHRILSIHWFNVSTKRRLLISTVIFNAAQRNDSLQINAKILITLDHDDDFKIRSQYSSITEKTSAPVNWWSLRKLCSTWQPFILQPSKWTQFQAIPDIFQRQLDFKRLFCCILDTKDANCASFQCQACQTELCPADWYKIII